MLRASHDFLPGVTTLVETYRASEIQIEHVRREPLGCWSGRCRPVRRRCVRRTTRPGRAQGPLHAEIRKRRAVSPESRHAARAGCTGSESEGRPSASPSRHPGTPSGAANCAAGVAGKRQKTAVRPPRSISTFARNRYMPSRWTATSADATGSAITILSCRSRAGDRSAARALWDCTTRMARLTSAGSGRDPGSSGPAESWLRSGPDSEMRCVFHDCNFLYP